MRSPLLRRAAQVIWLGIFAFALYILVMRTQATLGHSDIAAFDAVMGVIFELSFFIVAGLMIWRKAGDRMGLFTAFCLLLFGGIAASADPKIPPDVPDSLVLVGNVLVVLGNTSLFLFFYLFPDGRLVRPWLLALLVPGVVLQNVPGGSPPPTVIGALISGAVIFLPFAVIIYVQIYRYRKVSTPSQRQQTKWIVYGLAVGFLGFLITAAVSNAPGPGVRANILYQVLESFLLYGFLILVPLSIGLAILRYRLYEVDLLINRTLVYGSLTLSLAALYIGGVLGLQALFQATTGQSSDLAIAIVTLAVAALFNPWRHQLQRFIDRRFYRHKYDAARVLLAFTSHLRDEVDLDDLSGDLVRVLQETVQPSSVSLWLRHAEGEIA
jgi:hypothetical protein